MIIINLDKLLTERKMQSLELAKQLDCTVQTISRMKTGKTKAFRLEMLDDICKLFECQPGDVLEHVSEEEAIKRFGVDFVREYKEYHGFA